MYLDEKLEDVRIRNRTLMELFLVQIDKNKELKQELDLSIRNDIEDRIKKYYFD